MCGIAGLLSAKSPPNNLHVLLERMNFAQQHRGPDDQGIYISPCSLGALAHSRLSILDLSSAGHQPMSLAQGRFWISFNGEIYNYLELRQKLEAQGETFISNTDTEVILKLFQLYGKDCLKHLRGMFAFALWDEQQQGCFLARDPLGIKPLYFWSSGDYFLFASEIKALLATGLVSKEIDSTGLYGYLINGSVPEPYTLIKSVQLLKAGHFLAWKSGIVTQEQYWQIQFKSQTVDQFEAVEKTRSALTSTIEAHLISDVPVGIFLSGGIDSSTIVALSRQSQAQQLRTYSISFEEKFWNEGDVARRVANHFKTTHSEHLVSSQLGRELLSRFFAAIDQPTIDGFNTFCISYFAHQNGAKVVLSGLGGDELFGGYNIFQRLPQMLNYGKISDFLQPYSHWLGNGLEYFHYFTACRKIGRFLQSSPTLDTAYSIFRSIFLHEEALKIIDYYFPDLPPPELSCEDPVFEFPFVEDTISFLELSRYMRNQLLRDSDVMSMTWGLELRVPFVDSMLVDTLASIPAPIRLAQGKRLLKQAVPELPDWLLKLPKKGFTFPLPLWLSSEWRDIYSSTGFPPGISLKSWYRRWSLFILMNWWQRIIQT
uniref:asparagine synthase (glutamine-hydrolyzing) n=1 Tax=Cyanothece sp. (strain PCC 7425 / ATCC 29141) TaxID=395961 RepID=B8HND1_CYAP4